MGKEIMTMIQRVLLCFGILVVDIVMFFLPLTAFFIVYILIFNPLWFRDFLHNLDGPTSTH